MADLSKLSVEQRSLIEQAQQDGKITPEERAKMEKAGIAKEILDELAGDPGKIGDGSGNEPDFATYFEKGKKEAEEIKAEYRAKVRYAWNNGDYWTAVKTSFQGAMAPNNTHVQEAKAGKVLFAVLGAAAFLATSCIEQTEPDINVIHNETNYNIDVSVLTESEATNELINLIKDLINQNADLKTAIEDLKNSQDENAQKTLELLQQLVERLGQLEVGIDQIAQILFEQGASLDEIVALLEASNKTQDEILNALSNGHDEIRAYLENILNAINNGNEIDANTNKILSQLLEKVGNIEPGDNTEVLAMLEKIFAFVQESIDNNNAMDEKTYALLETLVESVNAGRTENAQFYQAIIDNMGKLDNNMKDYLNKILDSINENTAVSVDIRDLTKQVLDKMGSGTTGTDYTAVLEAILKKLSELSDSTQAMDSETKELIQKLIDSVNAGNEANATFYENILNKIDGLEGVMKDYLKNILDAVNANGTISEDIRNLTQKVLEQINNHSMANNDALKAILEAINNLSVGSGGDVDLSKIEEMLAALLKQSESNGEVLEQINGKLDIISMTLKTFRDEVNKFLASLDDTTQKIYNEFLTKLNEMIDKIEAGGCNCNMDFEALMNRLDAILEAIKNHKCECDCSNSGGDNNEGIVGSLDDILG